MVKKYNTIIQGPINDCSGVAQFVRNQALSLDKMPELDVKLESSTPNNDPINITPKIQEILDKKMDPKEAYFLQCSFPELWNMSIIRRPKRFFGYTVIEGTKIPPTWVTAMNDPDVDGIMSCSTATKRLFVENGVKADKIHIIGHGADPEMFKPVFPMYDFKNKGKFVFLYLNGWRGGREDRKGPEILLDAWAQDMVNEKDAVLIFKVNKAYKKNMNVAKEMKAIGHDPKDMPNVLINDQFYAVDQLPSLYSSANVYVTPTKGEAFGITLAESMLCGVPCIVTNNYNAGYMDFCNKDNSIFIETEGDIDVDDIFMGYLYSGSKWVQPSTKDLVKKLRWAFEHRDEVERLGLNAMKTIKNGFTWDHVSKRFVEVIKQYENKKEKEEEESNKHERKD